MTKEFRGCTLHITVKNPDHKESGCASLKINGTAVDGSYIPASVLQNENEIELVL
jgi:hypothetical protein